MPTKKKAKKIIEKWFPDWSSINDIPSYMVHDNREDAHFFFGTKSLEVMTSSTWGNNVSHDKKFVGKPQSHDGHIMVVGGAGSGKSTCIAMPTLETWKGTIFAIDIKGELTDFWKRLHAPKRPEKIFSLANDIGAFSSYDPFNFLRQDDERNLVQNAREIAHAIIPLPINTHEPFWIQSAQHVLTAVLLHGYSIGASFNVTITRILTSPVWDLINEINSGDNLAAKMHISQFKDIKNPADNRMLTGVGAELCNRVMVFVTNMQIKNSFSPKENTIDWNDLESNNIFLRIAEDKLDQWDGAITLMLTQLIRSLERRNDKQYNNDNKPVVLSAKGKEIPPVLLLFDEFPRLGKVDAIQNAVSTLRSKGVTICLIMQSLAQLDKIYGKESRQIIVDNCSYKAILQITDSDNQKYFSDMIGTKKTRSIAINAEIRKGKKIKNRPDKNDYSISANEVREPIIHPHDLLP